MSLRPLGPTDDFRPIAAVLARAFRDNPLNCAVIGGRATRRLRANRAGMRATLAAARPRCAIWVAEPAPHAPVAAGALIGMAPGVWPLAPPPPAEQLRALIGQGIRTARRWGEVFEALQVLHPVAPSAYLALVGVAPEWQGRGLGGALVARWLEEVDAVRAPACLETDRRELVSFYGRFGFVPRDTARLFGVQVWSLWRPRAGGGAV